MKRILPRLVFAALFSLTLAGCASKTAQTKPQSGPQEEYVSETSVGSWIPKKRKKSQTQGSDSDTEQAKRALEQAQLMGTRLPKDK